MIRFLISASLHNRFLVLFISFLLSALGLRALLQTPVDAIPDLSDVQVIIKTSYPGQAPDLVEKQVTFPLSTALLSVPGAQTVRGFSFYGDSFVYVIFADGTDIYWARSRVLEYLSQVADDLPEGATAELGPDASGVGWIYAYALQDVSGQHDLAQLRALQDWMLRYELQSIPGVAEVARVGGVVKQYQVQVDPEKLRFYGIPLMHIRNAIQHNNRATGVSAIELAEAEYMVRATGYIENAESLRQVALGINKNGAPLLLHHVADIVEAPAMRRGIAELDGKGEVVGGIVVMRHGENAQATINAVKQKLQDLKKSLPPTVDVVPVYDRSRLIQRAVANLWGKVLMELALVAVLLFVFLLNVRSVLVAMIILPVGILISFLAMRMQGVNANIMSLAGIAIAIGTMIDGAIVMIENLQRKLAEGNSDHWQTVCDSATEIGPTLFCSLLIITVSFLPVLALEAEEGRMFLPLALTKTYAMGAAAVLSVTLIPVLLYYLMRGESVQQLSRTKHSLNKILRDIYQALLRFCLLHARWVVLLAMLALTLALIPLQRLSSEFMPPLDEGDLMYMPTTYPGISIGKARELLQQTDKIIRTLPEVDQVFGKVGRAETATDPAPLSMIETFIQLKPRHQWRPGFNTEDIIRELEHKVKFPGVSNAWVMPIKTRIDMLSTGMKTPLGIKLAGPDVEVLENLSIQIETLLAQLPATRSVYAERNLGGRYITLDIQRGALAAYGLTVADVHEWLQMSVGDMAVGEAVQGVERYPISLRFPDHYRDTPERLLDLPLWEKNGVQIRLADVAELRIETGAHMLKSENARLNNWVFLDIGKADIKKYVGEAERLINEQMQWPLGYSLRWSGQFEAVERAQDRLGFIVPITLLLIALLLYWNFRRFTDVVLLLASLPFALVGGLLLLSWLDYKLSVAVFVGFIALAGLAVETGALMLQVLRANVQTGAAQSLEKMRDEVVQFAGQRLRPVLMTATSTIAGLMPGMFGQEPGSEIMARIATPMIGGLITSVLLTLFVIPALFVLMERGARRNLFRRLQ